MYTSLISFLIVIFLNACGGSSPSSSSINPIEINASLDNNSSILNEPYFVQQWYLYKNQAFYTRNRINTDANIHTGDILESYKGRGIRVAIIDNGFDMNHTEYKLNIANSFDVLSKSTDVSHTKSNDIHGTAVTGIISADINGEGIVGIASDANIILLKYKEFMSDSETIELFSKAQEFGADIISNSWGTGNVSPAVKAKIVDLAKNGRNGKGIVIVFASGNDNADNSGDESDIDEVISVGATDRENLRALYSNFGTRLDVVAPGGYNHGITTTDPSGSDGIASLDTDYLLYNDAKAFIGTSAAAPIVSGVIALMLQYNPNLTRSEVEIILHNTSDKIGNPPYDVNGRNNYYGYGKINLIKIFNTLKNN